MITSPRRIARMFSAQERHMRAMENDPMNDVCPCMGEIYSLLSHNWRRDIWVATRLSEYDAGTIVMNWRDKMRAKRLRHKNPLRLAWKKENSEERYHITMCSNYDEAFNWAC